MNNYDMMIASCVNVVDAQLNSPVFTQESVEDFVDVIRMHYDKILMPDKDRPTFEEFTETIASHFNMDAPPPIIKEHNVGGWLDRAMRSSKLYHWNYYRRMLIAQRKNAMLPYLDSDTFTILDSCMNPQEKGSWDRRGLVYGHIQSGKTANYIGLISKGFDLGYQIVILLTGMTEDLRKQTQDRVNEGIIGRDEDNNPYGVGKLRGFPFGISQGTTHVTDFSKSILPTQIANLKLDDRIVFVIKKNVAILNSLIKWLKKKSDEQRGGTYKIKDTPFLIIDDEADNASIKSITKREKDSGEFDLKAINRSIRIILSLIEQKSFVAYTATPYSVVLQRSEDKQRSWQIDGVNYEIDENTDLFPKHFIVPIRHGDNYFGIERVFGNQTEPGLPVVTQVDLDPRFRDNVFPNGGFFTSGRYTVYDFVELPDSLQNAILHFVVTVIVRKYRRQDDHNTMLVHTSHEVVKIDYVAHRISEYLSLVQNKVLHDPSIVKQCNAQLALIRNNAEDSRFKEYFGSDHLYQLPHEVTATDIHTILKDIDLVSLHSRKNDPTLNHKNHTLKYDRSNNRIFIVVGGNRLSRGLTIEGLSTSYFVRHSTRKDSLYQMGRWFGYRIGFEDCVRIYTHSDLYFWYRDVMILEVKLRKDLTNMNSNDEMTPENWEIKVARSSAMDSLNKKLAITDPNKLRHTAQRRLAFGGMSIRTKYFKKDIDFQSQNLKHALTLITDITNHGSYTVTDVYPRNNSNLNFAKVPPSMIIEFLNRFDFHEDQTQDFADLVAFLEEHGSKLNSFSVVLKRLQNKNKYRLKHEVWISPIFRTDTNKGKEDYYEIDALTDGHRDDTFDIIDENNEKEFEAEVSDKPLMKYDLRNYSKKALLIIYTVEGDIGEDGEKGLFPSLYLFMPTMGTKDDVLIRN